MSCLINNRFFYPCLIFCLVFGSGMTRADDTEIYFQGIDTTSGAIRSNVLFILDSSVSMERRVSRDTSSQQRIEAMRDAARQVLNSMENVNVGLMRFSGLDGGAILFPITNIDEDYTNVVGEDSNDNSHAYEISIQDGLNDVQMKLDDGTMYLRDGTINVDLVHRTGPKTPHVTGLRFEGVRIPQGARITYAQLLFKTNDKNPDSEWTVAAEAVDDSATFSDAASDISAANRPRTQASVTWDYVLLGGSQSSTTAASDSIKTVLQEIVNRQGWCGGNALSLFITGPNANANANFKKSSSSFQAYESGAGVTTRLRYIYEIPKDGGCMGDTVTAKVNSATDDVEKVGTSLESWRSKITMGVDSNGGHHTAAVRFQGVYLPQGVTVSSAKITFQAVDDSKGSASFTIKGIAKDNAPTFTSISDISDNINDITFTSASSSWSSNEALLQGELYSTSDLKTIVQEIINRPGWQSGNSMAFIIAPGTGTRTFVGNDGRRVETQLDIKYTYNALNNLPALQTVRERLINVIDNMLVKDSTPIQTAMYEAARYWRGEDMEYGDTKYQLTPILSSDKWSQLSHPGSYCTASGVCRGADTNNTSTTTPTDEYGVYNPPGCVVDINRFADECIERRIVSADSGKKPRYISPFQPEATCSGNYQVLLTDGEATSGISNNGQDIRTMVGGGSSCYADNNEFMVAGDVAHTYSSAESCTVDLAEYLATNDQSTSLTGDQSVKTYTVAFNLSNQNAVQYLKDISNLGQGLFYSANTATELSKAFTAIITDIKNKESSFVTPSLTANSFNRLLSRDEVYFGQFAPDLSASWYGNVKKYTICIDSADGCTVGQILDADKKPVVDDATGKFKETAKSIWSSKADGAETTEGGAGAEITDYTSQTLYTDKNASGLATKGTALSSVGFKLTSSTWSADKLSALRSAICPTPSTTAGSECEDRMLWLLGKSIVPDNDNDISNTQRWSVNDVMHSAPVVVTYGYNRAKDKNDDIITEFYDKVLYTTNAGVLHFVNAKTGAEEWRYMPSDFWAQQQGLYGDERGAGHIYGLDVTPTVWSVDNDGDGKIETADGDTVYAFLAARRGSNTIHALDISQTVTSASTNVVPSFLWRIQGGSGDYARLGQTWSQPQVAKISTKTTSSKDVLIFGGGYDPALDDKDVYEPADNNGNDFMGNAIYIVDSTDGSLILSISGTGSGADIEVEDMHYSIPSRVRLFDSNGDGDTDRLYVGDTGGQVWRVDLDPSINPASTSSPEANTVVARLADVSGTAAKTKRRFYEPPAIVQVSDKTYSSTQDYDYVLIGSGYRARPIDAGVEDRFYAFRDYTISPLYVDADSDGYADYDKDGNNVASSSDGYPKADGSPYNGSTLIDITSAALDATSTNVLTGNGWYYDFTAAGSTAEKVLSAPTVTTHTLTFTTFTPDSGALNDPCKGGIGSANAYNFNILSADAALDWDGDGDIKKNDRKQALGGGIPSDVVPVFTNEGVIGVVGSEGGIVQLGILSTKDGSLPRDRVYWYEED